MPSYQQYLVCGYSKCEDWLPPIAWDNVTEMDKMAGFQGLVSSFEQMARDWKVILQLKLLFSFT